MTKMHCRVRICLTLILKSAESESTTVELGRKIIKSSDNFSNSFYDFEFPGRNAIATTILSYCLIAIMLLSIYFMLTTTNRNHCGTKQYSLAESKCS